jgi:MFS family permease
MGLLLACVGLGMISRELLEYWGALVLLGVGWNFMFVAATVLLTQSYRPAERFKAQAFNDFTIFGTLALTSLSAGTVLFRLNWETLMLLNLPALAIMLLVLVRMRAGSPNNLFRLGSKSPLLHNWLPDLPYLAYQVGAGFEGELAGSPAGRG